MLKTALFLGTLNYESLWAMLSVSWAFPRGSDGEESACNIRDLGLIPGSRRCPREGNGYLLQYSCLENSMDRAAWWARVHGVAKSWTGLSIPAQHSIYIYIYLLARPHSLWDLSSPTRDWSWITAEKHWVQTLDRQGISHMNIFKRGKQKFWNIHTTPLTRFW